MVCLWNEVSRPFFFCHPVLCIVEKVDKRMCTSFRNRNGHSRKVGFFLTFVVCMWEEKAELRLICLFSVVCPVTDLLALVRCHFVDTEPCRLRLKFRKIEKSAVPSLLSWTL